MILMIDNYDSFTYNLVQYLGELGAELEVHRNDRISLQDVEDLVPEKVVISPGPCTPSEAGISVDLIRRFAGRFPILGVCLGHQSVGQAFGGAIVGAPTIMHGKVSEVFHDDETIFKGPYSRVRSDPLSLPGRRSRNSAGLSGGLGRDLRGNDYGASP